jgi:hypothetical protein
MRLAALIAATVVATVIGVIVLGTRTEPRLAASNGVDAGSFSVAVPDGHRHCLRGEFVPRDADRIRMTIGTFEQPMPPLDVTVTDADGRTLADRRVQAPAEGVVVLPLGRTTDQPRPDSTVCLTPHGRKIVLGGFRDRARIEWLRPGSESVLGLSGTVLQRFGVGKPGWMGGWTLVLAIALVVAVWALTARLLLREARA